MSKLKNIHPGEILLEEFLKPFEISAYKLSKDIGIPQTRTSAIIHGKRRITADIIPTDYDQLRKNMMYKNILQTFLTRREMDIFHQARLKSQMGRALNILNKELDIY